MHEREPAPTSSAQVPALVVSVPLFVSHIPTVGLSLGYSHYDNIKLKGATLLDDGSTYAFKETINGNSPMAPYGSRFKTRSGDCGYVTT